MYVHNENRKQIYIYIFTKWYRIISRFEKNVLNFQTSQTNVSKFSNVSIKDNPLGFAVKFYQNFQNTPHFFKKKKKETHAWIFEHFNNFFLKNKHIVILKILTEFNSKS
jgi:hypothetical protein